MSINLSLSLLFAQVFGVTGVEETPKDFEFGQAPARKETGDSGAAYYKNDLFGREYFLPVTVSYIESDLNEQDAALLGGDSLGIIKKWDLPHPLISISCRKNIVETALTERRGTVKELINMEDYRITIRGFIIAKTNEFPEDQVKILRTLFEQNRSIGISNAITDIFLLRPGRKGSDQVVIRELQFPEVVGVKNVRPYSFDLVSDEPFSLYDVS